MGGWVGGWTYLDEAVDAGGKSVGVVKGETGGEEGSVVEEPGEVLEGLVGLVRLGLVAEGLVGGWVDELGKGG